ncbi:MAG: hypothetical protein ACRCX2_24220 [Paraclostridium sp.]
MVHNDYEPLGVYYATNEKEAISRLMDDVEKGKIKVCNKNINAMMIHHD